MPCLYCSNEPNTLEHPLPAALGEFLHAPALLGKLCADCNGNRLGLLDEQYVRCGLEALQRARFNVEGRAHHEKVNPFYRGSAGGGRIEMTAWDENLQCPVSLELVGGNEARQVIELHFTEATGRIERIPLRMSMTPEELRTRFADLKLNEPYEARMTYDPPTEQWVPELVKRAFPSVTLSEPVPGSKFYSGGYVRLQLTDRYFRAIAKIGFHYFLTQFPSLSGSEPGFEALRTFIATDTNVPPTSDVNRFIQRRSGPMLSERLRKQGFRAHLLVCEIRQGKCLVHYEPFIHSTDTTQPRTIQLGFLEGHSDAFFSHIYLFYPDGRRGKYVGEIQTIESQFLDLSGPLRDEIGFETTA